MPHQAEEEKHVEVDEVLAEVLGRGRVPWDLVRRLQGHPDPQDTEGPGEDKTQKDVAEAAGVTEVTIRNRYKGLRSALGT